MLSIIGDAPYKTQGKWNARMVTVQCDCGAVKDVAAKGVRAGHIKSCGCASGKGEKTIEEACGGMEHDFLTVAGETFGPKPARGASQRLAICICGCGKEFTASPSAIKHNRIRGCGCRASTHGLSDTSEYGIWCGIKARCFNENNPSYYRYGGRGITMCERWSDYANFIADMGPRNSPEDTCERMDNDGNYEPDNCIWASRAVQALNKSSIIKFKVDKSTFKLIEFAAETGVRVNWLYHQVQEKGRPMSEIIRDIRIALDKYAAAE